MATFPASSFRRRCRHRVPWLPRQHRTFGTTTMLLKTLMWREPWTVVVVVMTASKMKARTEPATRRAAPKRRWAWAMRMPRRHRLRISVLCKVLFRKSRLERVHRNRQACHTHSRVLLTFWLELRLLLGRIEKKLLQGHCPCEECFQLGERLFTIILLCVEVVV